MPTRTFIVSEINGESVIDWDVTLDIKGAKKYILVAAMNYETGSSFIKYCNDYKNKIIADNKTDFGASGHVTLWTGENGKYAFGGHHYDSYAKAMYFWELK